MKSRTIFYYIAATALLSLFIAGCRDSEPAKPVQEATDEPTSAAPTRPTDVQPTAVKPTAVTKTAAVSTSAPEAAEQGPSTAPADFQNGPWNGTWMWIFFSDPAVGAQDIPEPERYQIVLDDVGTITIQADCNMVNGVYTTEDGSIMIDLGPSTMADCPDDSLAGQFVQNLSAAAIMFFIEDDMLLDLKFDSGTMRFSRTSLNS